MPTLADWFRQHTQDYGQLKDAYPNAKKFGSALKKDISDVVPTTEELQSPKKMQERAINYINPMAGTIGVAKNLNSELLQKYLSTGKLSPKEMAQYEANGLAMETPQLQRYNLANANAQGGSPESRAINNGYGTPVYHGMSAKRDFWGNSPDLIALNSETGKAEGNRLFSSDDPRVAAQYSGHRTETPVIYPLSIKDDSIFSAPIKNWDVDKGGTTLNGINTADDLGKNTALFKGVVDTPGYNPNNEFLSNVYASKKDVRSKFAAFDPLRKNSSSLLASLLGGTALVGQYDKDKKLKDMR